MGFSGGGLYSPIKSTLPPVQKTLLQKTGTAIFDTLDAPGNFTRSILVGDLGNAAKQLGGFIPGVDSRRVAGSEITGLTDDTNTGFFANLAVEILADPLLFVNHVGKLGKGAKALDDLLSAQRGLRAMRNVQKQLGMTERGLKEIQELEKLFETRKAAYKVLKKSGEATKGRSAVTLGIPFGRKLGEINIGHIPGGKPILTPAKTAIHAKYISHLTDELQDIERKLDRSNISKTLEEALRKDRQVVLDKIDRSERFGDRFVTGVLGLKGTEIVRDSLPYKAGKAIEKRFRFTAKDPQVEMLKDVYRTEAARFVTENETIHKVRMAELAESIGKIHGESIEETGKRLTHLAENPYVQSVKSVPTPDVHTAEKMVELRRKYGPKFEALDKRASKLNLEGDAAKFEKYQVERQRLVERFAKDQANIMELADAKSADYSKFIAEVGELIPEEKLFLSEYVHSLDQWIPLAKELGVDVEKLTSSGGLTRYAPRMISKEAKGLKKSNPDLYALAYNEFNARYSGAHRRILFPELSIDAANKAIRADFGIDFDFFRTDIVNTITERRSEMYRVLNKAAAINAVTDMFGVAKKAEAGSKPWTAKRVFERFGLVPKEGLEKVYIPKNVVNDIDRISSFFGDKLGEQEVLGSFFKFLNMTNSVFQASLTTLFPAFHHRNLVNNIAMNFMAGVKSKYMKDMYRLQRLAAKGELVGKDLDLWLELGQASAIRAGQFEEYKRFIEHSPEGFKTWWAKFDDFWERPVTKSYDFVAEKLGKKPKIRRREEFDLFTGRAYGSFIEENARGAHYLSKRAEGLGKIEAMRSMNKWLFDYSRLTDFEKKYLRPTVLFYTWSRNNIPLMLKTAFTNPRYGSVYTKLTGVGEEEVPQYLNRGFAFKAPPFVGPNEYFGSLGLGIEDLNLFNVGATDPNTGSQMRRFAENVLTRLAPAIKLPAETLLTRRESFTGRPLADIGYVERAVTASPLSRVVGTVKKLADQEQSMIAKLVDTMLGVRAYHVDKRKLAIDIANRRALSTGLFKRGSGINLKRQYKDDETAKKLNKELRRVLKENTE